VAEIKFVGLQAAKVLWNKRTFSGRMLIFKGVPAIEGGFGGAA
jgi:hypothetical protein